MASIYQIVKSYYAYLMYDLADQRTNHLPLIESPWYCIGLLVLYNYFVVKLGPKLMENRKPYNINRIIQIYNLTQVVCCGIFFYTGMQLTYLTGAYSLKCQAVDRSTSQPALLISYLFWCYFVLKMIDLFDTVFFVLRKKNNQITYLHIFHHTGMVVITWFGTKYMPGGHGILLGLINDFVHMIMYFYYFLTNYNPGYRKKIWWKKYLTQLQMVQFACIIVHFILLLISEPCGYPKWTAFGIIPLTSIMMYMFVQFYKHAYLDKSETAEKTSLNVKLTETHGNERIKNE